MIPQLVIIGGALYLIFKSKDDKTPEPPEPPEPPVTPSETVYSWNAVTTGEALGIDAAEGIVIWEYTCVKPDGTENTYIVIGDAEHKSFLRGGMNTIDIPSEASGAAADYTGVEVFDSIYDAERKLRSFDNKGDSEDSPQPTQIGEKEPRKLGQGYGSM